jgi:hypothetical protein
VTEFLNHLNGFHTNIQFTMEKEESHLPFLDSDIYKKTEFPGSQSLSGGHPYQSLSTLGFTSPSCKQSVLASMIHRAKASCDQDSLTQELEFLTTIFKDTRYSPQQIRQALKPATQTTKTNEKPTLIAYIPYAQKTYG